MGADADSTPSFPAVDWDLYRRLKAEGRLNLLFQQGPEMAAWLLNDKVTGCVPNVLPFVSRAEHLAWRKQWVLGRWQILSPPPELRAATLKQDAIYRERDARGQRITVQCPPVRGCCASCANSETPMAAQRAT
jgi:hypothetical protein